MTEELIVGIVIFTLATFLGAALIGRVPPTLHTPLMSGANAISGITIAGALIVAGADYGWISTVLGFLAIVFAMMNSEADRRYASWTIGSGIISSPCC